MALQVLHLQGVAGEDDAEGVVIIDDDAAVAVENLAARRDDGLRLDVIALGLFVVESADSGPAGPRSRRSGRGRRHAGVLEDGDLAGGELGIVAARLFAG